MTPTPNRAFATVDVATALVVVVVGFCAGAVYLNALWMLDENGFSVLSRRLPYWDFSNLWGGSRMALDGHVAYLFDVETYRATLRAMFSPLLPDQEWSYPPSVLLFGAPLAALPILPAYLIWTFGTVFCLWLAVRPLKIGPVAELAIVLSPAVMINAIFGQNGALTAALLLGGLLAAPKRPVLAGVMFGLLTFKPHLGLLIPFCLLASGNWRAITSAAVTTAAIVVATGALFGFDVWTNFFVETRPLMTAIMEAPYPQPYHFNAMTVFSTARALGFGLAGAYGLQAAMSLAAIAVAIWAWLPDDRIEHRQRAVLTVVLAMIATPYGYTYDSIGVAIAVAFIFMTSARLPLFLLAASWFYAVAAQILNNLGYPIGILVPLWLAVWMVASILKDKRVRPVLSLPLAA